MRRFVWHENTSGRWRSGASAERRHLVHRENPRASVVLALARGQWRAKTRRRSCNGDGDRVESVPTALRLGVLARSRLFVSFRVFRGSSFTRPRRAVVPLFLAAAQTQSRPFKVNHAKFSHGTLPHANKAEAFSVVRLFRGSPPIHCMKPFCQTNPTYRDFAVHDSAVRLPAPPCRHSACPGTRQPARSAAFRVVRVVRGSHPSIA
jgi:hypothetical protein